MVELFVLLLLLLDPGPVLEELGFPGFVFDPKHYVASHPEFDFPQVNADFIMTFLAIANKELAASPKYYCVNVVLEVGGLIAKESSDAAASQAEDVEGHACYTLAPQIRLRINGVGLPHIC